MPEIRPVAHGDGPAKRRALLAPLIAVVLAQSPVTASVKSYLAGPPASVAFGTQVKFLPNGNFVVTDPAYAAVPGAGASGAVFLYDASGSLISTLTGTGFDHVGSGGVYVLANGNFVVCSPAWSGGPTSTNYGAATFVDGKFGLSGQVSAANSLIGERRNDSICSNGVTTLPNGSYVVASPNWSSASAYWLGAATWCNGTTGCTGTISAENSLIGAASGDRVGTGYLTLQGSVVLSSGNYVVTSPNWSNGAAPAVGAITLCPGTGGCVGTVAPSNSLIGSAPYSYVGGGSLDGGEGGAIALANGNFVVLSPFWISGGTRFGAVTWVDGNSGLIGEVSAANSLVGTAANDFDMADVIPLRNGNYVVAVSSWDNGGAVDVGAATLCSGSTGCVGGINPGNSSAVPLTTRSPSRRTWRRCQMEATSWEPRTGTTARSPGRVPRHAATATSVARDTSR